MQLCPSANHCLKADVLPALSKKALPYLLYHQCNTDLARSLSLLAAEGGKWPWNVSDDLGNHGNRKGVGGNMLFVVLSEFFM